jgi:hypothetical protein
MMNPRMPWPAKGSPSLQFYLSRGFTGYQTAIKHAAKCAGQALASPSFSCWQSDRRNHKREHESDYPKRDRSAKRYCGDFQISHRVRSNNLMFHRSSPVPQYLAGFTINCAWTVGFHWTLGKSPHTKV